MSHRTKVLLLALAACLAFAAPAHADLQSEITADYVNDGRLDPCKYSEKVLQALKDLVPNDGAQYSDFLSGVDDALARRAAGACNKKGGSTPSEDTTSPSTGTSGAAPPASGGGTGTPSSGAGTPATPGQPAAAQPPPTPTAQPVAAPAVADVPNDIGRAASTIVTDTDPPFPLLALAALAIILALGLATVGLCRWRCWQPAWAQRFGHAAGEAGWRASSTFAEFADFVRFGR